MNKVRYKYLDTLCQMVDKGEDIVIVSSDYAAPSLDAFRTDHKERYVSVGIAEQNLIQVSCGIQLAGHTTIAYGMAPFPCIRAVDQIKNTASLMNIPISIVSAGVGFAIPEFGATHYCAEDIAIIRTIPGIKIINLTDQTMAKKTAELSVNTKQPLYIRIDKYSDSSIYNEEDIDFEEGFTIMSQGKDITLIGCGYYSERLMLIAETLKEKGISAKVIDLFSIPFNEKHFIEEIENDDFIMTVEEHVLQGGIGTIILEALNKHGIVKRVKRMGIDFGSRYTNLFGSREYFMKKYGLDDKAITSMILSFVSDGSLNVNKVELEGG